MLDNPEKLTVLKIEYIWTSYTKLNTLKVFFETPILHSVYLIYPEMSS